MSKKWDLVSYSDYPPETCVSRLAEQLDVDKRALFSLSGYKGSKTVVGRIDGDEFRLHWRRYWRNNFGPVLFARVSAQGKGTLIEGYWEICKWTRTFMRVWLIFAALIGVPIFFTSLKCAAYASCASRGNDWVGLLVPPGMLF